MNTLQESPFFDEYLLNIEESVKQISAIENSLPCEDTEEAKSIRVEWEGRIAKSRMDKPPYLPYPAQLYALKIFRHLINPEPLADDDSFHENIDKRIRYYRDQYASPQIRRDLFFVPGWLAWSPSLNQAKDPADYMEGLAFGGHHTRVHEILKNGLPEPSVLGKRAFDPDAIILFSALTGYARANNLEKINELLQDYINPVSCDKICFFILEDDAYNSILLGAAEANNKALVEQYKAELDKKINNRQGSNSNYSKLKYNRKILLGFMISKNYLEINEVIKEFKLLEPEYSISTELHNIYQMIGCTPDEMQKNDEALKQFILKKNTVQKSNMDFCTDSLPRTSSEADITSQLNKPKDNAPQQPLSSSKLQGEAIQHSAIFHSSIAESNFPLAKKTDQRKCDKPEVNSPQDPLRDNQANNALNIPRSKQPMVEATSNDRLPTTKQSADKLSQDISKSPKQYCKDELIILLDSYLGERTNIRSESILKAKDKASIKDLENKYQYFHWYSKFFGGISYNAKKEAVEALTKLLKGDASIDITEYHLKALQNGSLGARLKVFIQSDQGKSLLKEETKETSQITTIRAFIENLQIALKEKNVSSFAKL